MTAPTPGPAGHTEVVQLIVPSPHLTEVAEAMFGLLVGGEREDTQDKGPQYRTALGLPGGTASAAGPRESAGAGDPRIDKKEMALM